MPLLADILGPVVNATTDFIGSAGLAGIFVLMLLGSACIPIPSEVVMLFAGFNVSDGNMTMIGIFGAGLGGNMAGSWLSYAAGYYGRIELLERNRFVHVGPKQLEWADRWFTSHGSATVFWTRMVPFVRAFISLPAGVARMPFWRFSLLTLLGSIPWVLGLGLIGRAVGPRWEDWRDRFHYLDYAVVAAIVLAVAYLVLKRRRESVERGAQA